MKQIFVSFISVSSAVERQAKPHVLCCSWVVSPSTAGDAISANMRRDLAFGTVFKTVSATVFVSAIETWVHRGPFACYFECNRMCFVDMSLDTLWMEGTLKAFANWPLECSKRRYYFCRSCRPLDYRPTAALSWHNIVENSFEFWELSVPSP